MSNLGLYQTMTTLAKKVGGPADLGILTLGLGAGLGAAVGKGFEVLCKKISHQFKEQKKNSSEVAEKTYTVKTGAKYDRGLTLNVGDSYRILASDGDSVLIEKLNDSNNPYFVSASFLRSVSDFA